MLGLLSSHSLAQNDCGHISNIPADHVHLGKGWMLRVDAVAVADGENPLSACPDQGSPPFSLTKLVRLPSSLSHCRDVGSCRLPPPSSRLSYVPQVQLPLQPACTTAPAAHITPCGYFSTSLPRTYLIPLLASTYCICGEFMSHQLVPVIFATGMLISILVKLHKMIQWSKGCKLHLLRSSNVASKLKPVQGSRFKG